MSSRFDEFQIRMVSLRARYLRPTIFRDTLAQVHRSVPGLVQGYHNACGCTNATNKYEDCPIARATPNLESEASLLSLYSVRSLQSRVYSGHRKARALQGEHLHRLLIHNWPIPHGG